MTMATEQIDWGWRLQRLLAGICLMIIWIAGAWGIYLTQKEAGYLIGQLMAFFHLPGDDPGPGPLWLRAFPAVIAAISGFAWIWVMTADWRDPEYGGSDLSGTVFLFPGACAVLVAPILALSWFVHPCDIEGSWNGGSSSQLPIVVSKLIPDVIKNAFSLVGKPA